MPAVAVIIPLRRLNAYVRECLDHLRRQTYRDFAVFVVTDEPETMAVEGLKVTFMASGAVPPNIKRMMAAQATSAEIVALIDDDAHPTSIWLERAVRHFADPDVVGVGGPAITPPSDPPTQQVSGAVYASPLVSAGYVYRYLPGEPREVDDYPSCNLILRREAFLRHVAQCSQYWPGEDTKLCLLLTKGDGKRIMYDPEVAVFHHRRKLFWGHFRQVWNYAIHRGFFVKRYPETSRRPQYFIPALFVLANLGALLLALAVPVTRPGLLLVALAYALIVGLAALAARRSHPANPLIVASGIYLTHLTYGFGFLIGMMHRELEH